MENWKRPMELEAALPTELIENEIFLNCLDLPSQVSFSLVAKKYRSFFLLKIFPSVLIACNNDENVPVKDWKALAVLLVKTVEYHYLGLFYYFYDYLGIQQIFFETPISHHAILAAFQVGDWPLFNSFRDKIPPDRTLVERCDFSSLRKCPPVAFLERVLNEEEISWLRAELDSSVIRYQLICLCCVAFYDGNLELVKLLGQGLSKRNLRLPMDDIFVLAAYFGTFSILNII